MVLTIKPRYLLDANVLIACAFEDHTHFKLTSAWFNTPGLVWALSPIAEAAFLRYAIRESNGNLSVKEATEALNGLSALPNCQFQPLATSWHTLTKPFFKRLHGHKQVQDAYLLGQAIQQNLIMATFDKAMLHMAGEHRQHVHILGAK